METMIDKSKIRREDEAIVIPALGTENLPKVFGRCFEFNGVKYYATDEFLEEMRVPSLQIPKLFSERKVSKHSFKKRVTDEEIEEYIHHELRMEKYKVSMEEILHNIFSLTALQPNGVVENGGYLVTYPKGYHNIMGFCANYKSPNPVIIASWMEDHKFWCLWASPFHQKKDPCHLENEVLFLPVS